MHNKNTQTVNRKNPFHSSVSKQFESLEICKAKKIMNYGKESKTSCQRLIDYGRLKICFVSDSSSGLFLNSASESVCEANKPYIVR